MFPLYEIDTSSTPSRAAAQCSTAATVSLKKRSPTSTNAKTVPATRDRAITVTAPAAHANAAEVPKSRRCKSA
ncbi:hypothetical protein GCM10022243_33440 [Saccharothrix violaceirubra]|uniref:Uncharacterized protein n=1 Tax=Saccharothrix violaceirubra TaxID=413306 RepID=A0A7W7T077_9PSEU|nr:hypothetical protein [Saccharothrix violaceirubra]MBB4964193.1 hypothetical protein [Saccharothrix violaceirubra]